MFLLKVIHSHYLKDKFLKLQHLGVSLKMQSICMEARIWKLFKFQHTPEMIKFSVGLLQAYLLSVTFPVAGQLVTLPDTVFTTTW